jgi:hypothetical protein
MEVSQARRIAVDLIDSFRRDWIRLGFELSPEERAGIHAHLLGCVQELTGLVGKLEGPATQDP